MHLRPALDADEAQRLLDAATAEALANAWAVSIAVVDDGGHLLAFRRLPDAAPSSAWIAIDKARSAALFRRPTRFFAERLGNAPGLATLPAVLPVAGGLPLLHDGFSLGGIGASGVAADDDERIAEAGLRALAAPAPDAPLRTPH
ncbi:GlcG/HbpS family heme-binding protein [Pseudomonas citronellolis]|uniref:GlcG/HbpS family heme-binding protein n=1 Tax=Pseudomonas citronellolis TaxID=53408 RepID=UPI003C30139C